MEEGRPRPRLREGRVLGVSRLLLVGLHRKGGIGRAGERLERLVDVGDDEESPPSTGRGANRHFFSAFRKHHYSYIHHHTTRL